MKSIFRKQFVWMAVAMIGIMTITGGCDKASVFKGLDVWQGPADLTITNMTTGESRRDKSTITIGGNDDPIEFSAGHKMKLEFAPPKGYEDKKFTVNFQVLDIDVNVSSSPYFYEIVIPDDVMPGDYVANCSALCGTWSDQSRCTQGIPFQVVD